MKQKLFILLFFIALLLPLNSQASQPKIDFFFSPTCPHCAEEEVFLDNLITEFPGIEIKRHSVFQKENISLLNDFYKKYQIPQKDQGWIPVTFTEKKYFIGFDEKIGEKIKDCLKECSEGKHISKPIKNANAILKEKVKIPLIGTIYLSKLSPLAMAIVLGGLDGFNACAMTALIFLLTALIATGTRKRLILIGATFILVSGLVYFIFISAWLNLFLVLGKVRIITYLIGGIVTVFAIFMLKDYFHGVVCKLCQVNPEKKENLFVKAERKLFGKMQSFLDVKTALPLTILGVAIVAAGINLVELVCSFGFPVAFSRFLTSLSLSRFSYYLYILIYIFFYMLDDFIVFLVAIFTLRIIKESEKYLKAIKLLSSIVLLVLGLLMLFKPGLLMSF